MKIKIREYEPLMTVSTATPVGDGWYKAGVYPSWVKVEGKTIHYYLGRFYVRLKIKGEDIVVDKTGEQVGGVSKDNNGETVIFVTADFVDGALMDLY